METNETEKWKVTFPISYQTIEGLYEYTINGIDKLSIYNPLTIDMPVGSTPKEVRDTLTGTTGLHNLLFNKVIEKSQTTNTGLRYNTGKPKWSLIDYKSIEPMVRVLEYGMHKYSTFENNHSEEVQGSEVKLKEDGNLPDGYELIRSGKDNWKGGMNKEEVLESAMRHLISLMSGEENDKESGLPHEGHVLCNMMFYRFNINKEKNNG